MRELKPCPFCGGVAKLKKGYPSQQRADRKQAFVQCSKCGAKTQTLYHFRYEARDEFEDHVVELWNRRADDKEDNHE